jgi:hypothetical protein
MPPSTQILQFDSSLANLQPQASYAGSSIQLNGFTAGVVDPTVMNIILQQASFIAAGIANFCVAQGISVPNDGNMTNLVAELEAAFAAFISGGGSGPVSFIQVYAGNPNGHVAGSTGVAGVSAPTIVWDTSDGFLWICTTSGNAATAVWSLLVGNVGSLNLGIGLQNSGGTLTLKLVDSSLRVSSSGVQTSEPIVQFTSPYSVTAGIGGNNGNNLVGFGTINLPQVATTWNGFAFSVLANGGLVNLNANAADGFDGGAAGATYQLTSGTSALFVSDGATNWWVFNITTPVSVQGSPYNFAYQQGFIL